MAFVTESSRWTVLAFANIPLYLGLGNIFFGSWADFWDSVKFWLMPDWISLLRGEYLEDRWAETKLLVFVALCALVLYGEHHFIWPSH